MMVCADVAALLDAFVDSELPPSTALEVARHAGQCARCDVVVRDLLAVREAVVAASERDLAGLDLSGVWTHVAAGIDRADVRTARHARGATRRAVRPVRRVVLWGSLTAVAAGAALMIRSPLLSRNGPIAGDGAPVRVAAKRLPNSVYIDRLAGKDIALRREPKSGTTMIWVNHEVEGRQ